MDAPQNKGFGIWGISNHSSGNSVVGKTLFNASQYDFFGSQAVEEYELGGLEGDGAEENGCFQRMNTDDARFSSLGSMEEGDGLLALSGTDDLASVFSKLNTSIGGPRNAGVIGDRRSLSRDSSSTAEWSQDGDFSDRVINSGFAPENILVGKRWWSQPQSPSSPVTALKPLYRTTTYPQEQPLLAGPTSPPPPPPAPPPLLVRHTSLPLNLPPPPAQPSFSSVGSQLRHGAAPYNSVFSRNRSNPVHHHHHVLIGSVQQLPYSPAVRPASRGSSQRPPRPKLRSKYMTMDDMEGIQRSLHLAGHPSGDLYLDDYYHQACIAKRAAITGKTSFRPAAITDGPTHRNRSGHHCQPARSFIQTDSAGRFSFTPLRCPEALLQTSIEPQSSQPLELEPLVAARVTIEDGFYLLLDVEDIDRVLQGSGSGGNSAQLRRRRQVLVEGLAASLQLVDPLGRATKLGPNDDLVFLRLMGLPKGRKLVAKYLRLVNGSDIARKVCMAVFRHLRFLYGPAATASTSSMATATSTLTQAVVVCVGCMDLSGLGACLVAVVCSSEQPPLRPIRYGGGGDGASVLVRAVLDQATMLLSGPGGPAGFSLEVRSLWQASFNAFFGLLSKYCMRKYDAVVHSLVRRGGGDVAADVARAVGREMPVELLQASLRHTDDQQQMLLREFVRRSTVIVAPVFNGSGGVDPFGSGFVLG